MKYAVINRNTSGELVAAVTGKRIRVLSYLFSMAVATTVRFDSATTALTGAMTTIAGQPFVSPSPINLPGGSVGQFQTEPGEALNVTLGAGQQISGHLVYEEVR